MPKCRCGVDFSWQKTVSGKAFPMESNRKVIMVRQDDGTYKATSGYENHFANCPFSKSFRKNDDDVGRGRGSV